MALTLKVKRLDKEIPIVNYAHPGDAAFDLYARTAIRLEPGERVQVPTGIAIEIPDGFVGLIWDKSGLSHKQGLKTLGGVIDAGYRGEVAVGIVNLGKEVCHFEKGNKVAQMIIQAREHVVIEEVEELTETVRGEAGFGSTGK